MLFCQRLPAVHFCYIRPPIFIRNNLPFHVLSSSKHFAAIAALTSYRYRFLQHADPAQGTLLIHHSVASLLQTSKYSQDTQKCLQARSFLITHSLIQNKNLFIMADSPLFFLTIQKDNDIICHPRKFINFLEKFYFLFIACLPTPVL